MVQCSYLKKEAPGLTYAPYPGELGKRIYDNVSKEAFEAWTKHQTMLVNENRLNLADARVPGLCDGERCLDEVLLHDFPGLLPAQGDRVVVLRDGRVAGARRIDETTPEEVILLIVGRDGRIGGEATHAPTQ